MDYVSSNAFFCVLLLLIPQRHAVTSRGEQSFVEHSIQRNGVWINKGLMHSLCLSLQFERRRCANFSLIQRPVPKSRVLRPDCAFLMNRLRCSLYKLNCPSHPDSSFQHSELHRPPSPDVAAAFDPSMGPFSVAMAPLCALRRPPTGTSRLSRHSKK